VTLAWAICRREALAREDVEGMLRIHRSLYEAVDSDRFLRDLSEKDEVVLVRDGEGTLRGYTTLMVFQDERGWVLFSGDTGVERCAWGSSALQVGWLSAAMRWHEALGPLDWLLLAGGPRTYRYLPVFFREYWPRPDAPAPARLLSLADHRYGERHQAGIVHLEQPPLRAEHDLPRPADPHDTFFRAANPGWTRGDELVCLTRICPENLTDAGRRILRSARAR
jgi:hypothetical protein